MKPLVIEEAKLELAAVTLAPKVIEYKTAALHPKTSCEFVSIRGYDSLLHDHAALLARYRSY